MAPAIPALLAAVSVGVGAYLPSPYDRDGIGLRVHNLSANGPYLVGEDIGRVRFTVMLVNRSMATVAHDPIVVATRTKDLVISVSDPDGKPLQRFGHPRAGPRDPFTEKYKLRPDEVSSLDLHFKRFAYWILPKPGRYRVEGTWMIDGRKYSAPPVEFVVVDVPPESVLSSVAVPLSAKEAMRPVDEQYKPRVQQIKMGKKTLLIYTGNAGVSRLAELPGKVEMTVEGEFGIGDPITIRYSDSNSTTGTTTIVINSLGGTPWTAEDERARTERTNSRIAPAPRVVKP